MELAINDKGFTGITELNDNFVFLHPTDKQLRRNIFVHSKGDMYGSSDNLLEPDYAFRPFPKNRNFGRILRLLSQWKLTGRHKYGIAMQINQYIESNEPVITIITANFDDNFYKASPDNNPVLVKVENRDLPLNKDLIFKYVTVNISGNPGKLPVFFKPSKYLENEKDIWKLISILGEKGFNKHLFDNNFIVNENFISEAFKHSSQVFYLSLNKKKVFSSPNERFEAKYGPLTEISLSDLLEKTTVNKIEEVLEKSETDI